MVASLPGDALNLKPTTSCNDEGIYHTVARTCERKQLITRIKELALDSVQGYKRCNTAIIYGDIQEMAEETRDCTMKKLLGTDAFTMKRVFPVLDVHTGLGMLGTYVQILDEVQLT